MRTFEKADPSWAEKGPVRYFARMEDPASEAGLLKAGLAPHMLQDRPPR